MLRGKRVILVLIRAAGLLALLTSIAYAQQNTGAAPYRDSEHAYRVSIGAVANERVWTVYDVTNDVETTILNTITPEALPGWATLLETGDGAGQAGAGYHGVRILFDRAFFTPAKGNNWQLRYYEYLAHDEGPDHFECVAARQFNLTLSDNSFWLEVSTTETDRMGLAGMQIYNTENTEINNYNDLVAPHLFITPVNYTVTMHKNDDFDPSYWQFTANFASPVHSFSATVHTENGGNAITTIVAAGSEYTVTVTPPVGFNLSEVRVNLSVEYEHDVLADQDRNLVVDEGVAVYTYPVSTPQPPDIVTDDNISEFPVGNVGNRTQAITILAIPSTRNITFDNSVNTSETATSAQNPLQSSTHYYKVEMGDIDNTGVWRLENSLNVVVLSEGSGITASENATEALAMVEYGTLPTGSYTLYFTETDATRTSSTVRAYPITLGEPLNVTLALTGDAARCATVSGTIVENDDLATPTTTQVTYTVSLTNAGYVYGWTFDYAFSTGFAGGFDALDVEISGITAGGVANTAPSGSVTVAPGTASVIIVVTYSGFYVNQHVLTLDITNIAGSFSDSSADLDQVNTLYPMPQPGALAGVD